MDLPHHELSCFLSVLIYMLSSHRSNNEQSRRIQRCRVSALRCEVPSGLFQQLPTHPRSASAKRRQGRNQGSTKV